MTRRVRWTLLTVLFITGAAHSPLLAQSPQATISGIITDWRCSTHSTILTSAYRARRSAGRASAWCRARAGVATSRSACVSFSEKGSGSCRRAISGLRGVK